MQIPFNISRQNLVRTVLALKLLLAEAVIIVVCIRKVLVCTRVIEEDRLPHFHEVLMALKKSVTFAAYRQCSVWVFSSAASGAQNL